MKHLVALQDTRLLKVNCAQHQLEYSPLHPQVPKNLSKQQISCTPDSNKCGVNEYSITSLMCKQNLLVTHHQDLKLLDIVHQKLLEASWQHVLCLLVATITDVWHQHLTLEPPADPVVNTSGLTPVFLQEI